MNHLIPSIALLILILQRTTADCDSDCTECINRDACVASPVPDGCAWSTNCISSRNTPFILYPTQVTGNAAVDVCIDNGLELASIRNEQENELVTSICDSQGVGGDCWIGLRYINGPDFEWLDGTPFTYGSYDNGISDYPRPPWQTAAPANCGVGNTELSCCVFYNFDSEWGSGWYDRECDSHEESTLCRNTRNPSASPTRNTQSPTNTPTTDDSDDYSNDSDDSNSDSSDNNAANALFNEKEELNGNYNNDNIGVKKNVINVHFSEETTMILWILFGVLFFLNIVFCFMSNKRKGGAAIDDTSKCNIV